MGAHSLALGGHLAVTGYDKDAYCATVLGLRAALKDDPRIAILKEATRRECPAATVLEERQVFSRSTTRLPAYVGLLAAGLLVAGAQRALAGTETSMTEAPAAATVTGVASYRERIALPPGTVFEAVLEDVTLADAPAPVMGKTVLENPMPPIRFTIPFDPSGFRLRAATRYGRESWSTGNCGSRRIPSTGC